MGYAKIFKKSLAMVLALVMVVVSVTLVNGTQVSAAPAAPFGLVVSSPADNTIGVVWGRGSIDSYNVYIDGSKVSSKVVCAYYEYKGYSAGSHKVEVSVVSGSEESAKVSETVTVNGSSNSSNSGSSGGSANTSQSGGVIKT